MSTAAPPRSVVPRRAWVEQIMGMPVSIHLRGDLDEAEPVVAEAFSQFRHVDAGFSTYRHDSEVSRIRRGEITMAEATAAVRGVADLCERARQLTGGAFDAYLPDRDDPAGRRRFDPTGLVKGWAVQRVAVDLAVALPGADVLVNAGGDIAVHCNRTDTPDWRLAVEDPLNRGEVVADLRIRQGGLATSGTAARGAHLVDPRTGTPATGLVAVTVAGPSLMWADVLATAGFVMGAEEAPGWLAGLEVFTWMTIAPDGATRRGTGSLAPGARRP